MPNHLSLITLSLCLALFAGAAHGVVLNGVGIQRSLGSEIFYAGLLLESPSGDIDEILALSRPIAMEVKVTDTISKRSWSSLWTQGVAINTSTQDFVRNAEAFSRLLSAFQGELVPGDVVRFVYRPGTGMGLEVNDVELLTGLPDDIFRLLLRSWLGPVPPSTIFRESLLGKPVDGEVRRRYQTLGPTAARRTLVAGWRDSDNVAASPAAAGELAPQSDAVSQPKQGPAHRDTPSVVLPAKEELAVLPPRSPEAAIPVDLTAPGPSTGTAKLPPADVEADAGRQLSAQPSSAQAPAADSGGEPSVRTAEDGDGGTALSAEGLIAQQAYISAVRDRVYRSIDYPLSALRRKLEGQLRVAIEVNAEGEVLNVTLVEPSDFDGFNREIVRAIESSAPFERLPQQMAHATFTIDTPFSFRIEQ